jgi:uncharacterized protein YqjF (DUF2071 family)
MICRPRAGGELAARFQVAGHEQSIPHGSLDFWLLERYRLFVRTAAGRLVVGEVEHPPWKLRPVQLIDVHNSLSGMQRLSINSPPDACHYSSGVAAKFGRFHDLSARAAHFKHAIAMASLPQARASARCAVQ